ncbi:MAG: DNA polymerase III subunit delta [Lachnospiraceae bacterium]|nr:DNA polymerase III subunit delta [Lachnospiraceae bacterium]
MAGFSEVLGQEHIKEHFQRAVQRRRVAHAYLIEGEEGMGKRMVARAAAMAIQCERQDGFACGECLSCRQMMTGKQPDVREIVHEKPNVLKIDEVREQLVQDMPVRPYANAHKIYIVPDADKMNPQAQNAILKTIEEPPPYGIIFLLVKNRFLMTETVRSRCVKMTLHPLSDAVIVDYLMQKCGVTDYRAEEVAAFAGGNLGKAVRLANGDGFFELKNKVVSVMKKLPKLSDWETEGEAKNITQQKEDIPEFLNLCELWFRDVLYVKSAGDVSGVHFTEEKELLKQYAENESWRGIQENLERIAEERVRISSNVNTDAGMELMLMGMKDGMKDENIKAGYVSEKERRNWRNG